MFMEKVIKPYSVIHIDITKREKYAMFINGNIQY